MTAGLPTPHPARPPARYVEDRGRYATFDGEGAVVDRSAAVTALAGAVAGDAWRQVHEAIARLWRRGHSPQQADTIGAELDELREQLLQARRDGDTGTEHALEGAWQHRPLARRCNPVGCPAAAPGSAAAPCTTGTTGSSPVRASGSKRCTTGGRAVRALQAR